MLTTYLSESVSPVRESPRYFALCESCFWSATVLRNQQVCCPCCKSQEQVSLIPLQLDESYTLSISAVTGMQVSFSYCKGRS